jgi:hypothetical protein
MGSIYVLSAVFFYLIFYELLMCRKLLGVIADLLSRRIREVEEVYSPPLQRTEER